MSSLVRSLATPDDVHRFLRLLARSGDVFELRAISKRNGKPQIVVGYFDDMGKLATAAIERSGKDDGVYVTLNPVHHGLLSRQPPNRVHPAGMAASDKDVTTRRHLLIDIDPVRPADISSSDDEHIAAIGYADQIAVELKAVGWPEPLIADSGNGGHLIYAIDLPRDDDSLVKRVLAQLSKRYSTTELKIDEKVFNPSRISKIYGTLTRKGENTPERPHRVSRIVSAPAELAAVTRAQLEAFASAATSGASRASSTARPSNGIAHKRFDLDAFIAEHLPDAEAQPWSGGEHGERKWLIPTCPFNDGHDRKEAFIVQMYSGAISAGCKHDSCKWTWRELRKHFEPNAYDRARNRLVTSTPDGAIPHAADASPSVPVDRERFTLTELGNAQRFARMHGDCFRYVHQWRQWIAWDGRRWKRDELGLAMRAAKEVVAELYREASQLLARSAAELVESDGTSSDPDKRKGGMATAMADHAKRSSKNAAIRAMLSLAQSEEPIAATSDQFDRDQFAFNVLTGTLDLRTGTLRPHRQSDLITKLAPVVFDPAAPAPRWEKFLARVQPDPDTLAWLQRFSGYSLSGDFTEQVLCFMHGSGGNGKNVYLDTIAHVMGDYAIEAEPDLLLAKQNESHPTGIADLDGARMVVCSEIDEGRAWNEALLKRTTGNKRLKARHMHENFYHFDATHKLIISANSKPRVRGTDNGTWRRMNLVPFDVTIPKAERDEKLINRIIAEESSGVLAWLVRGFAAWQSQGLGHCAAIDEATKRYREEQDVLGLWIAEECVVTPGAFAGTTALHDAFTEWCKRTGRPPWTRDELRARLEKWPGVMERRTNVARGYDGIGLVYRGDRGGDQRDS